MGGSFAVDPTLFVWRSAMKKYILIPWLVFLSACQTSEAPVIEEPITPPVTYIQPAVFLNHPDRDTMPLASSFEDVGVCYQIFVISFADANDDGLGDLNGITDNLDYLQSLNVQCIWLTPIHPSPSYHKYDVLDFYDIDPDFGTLQDFDRLIEEAAERGIVVLMDLVLNHTSKRHPWFTERPEFYRFISKGHPEYGTSYWHPHNGLQYYAYFWDQMPELNLDRPEVREATFDIARFWLDRGVGGFRLDAVRHFFDTNEYPIRTNTLQQNIRYLKEFNEVVKTINPEAIVLAEVWSAAEAVARYLPGIDSAFNFDLGEAIVSTVASSSDNASTDVVGTFLKIKAFYDEQTTPYHDSLFLTNHDQDRVMSILGGEAKARLAANILFTLPGVSWIYYGEELGMRGARTESFTDAERRQPMPWQSTYQVRLVDGFPLEFDNQRLAPGNEMFQHYQTLTALKQDPVIRLGEVGRVTKTQRHFLAYTLTHNDTSYLVVHNLSNQVRPLMVDTDVAVVYDIQAGIDPVSNMQMQPYSTVVFRVPTTVITLPFE
jgi:alpha-amylase